MKKYIVGGFLISVLFTFTSIRAGGIEVTNSCKGTTDDPCMRHGYCSIQGSDWQQWVTAARSDKFDTQGWPGVCDMVHVALVQGNCMPVGSRTSVTAFLVANSTALIGSIEGTLSCGGDDGSRPGGGGSFCDSHPNNRRCQ